MLDRPPSDERRPDPAQCFCKYCVCVALRAIAAGDHKPFRVPGENLVARATGGAASQEARPPLARGAAVLPNQVATRTIGSCISVACSTGRVRADLPQSLLIDSTMSLLESPDRWAVAHWSELAADEKEEMPRTHIALFRRLLSADAARAVSDKRP
jgi:hypothetical protein